jgi:hypothetical protein
MPLSYLTKIQNIIEQSISAALQASHRHPTSGTTNKARHHCNPKY